MLTEEAHHMFVGETGIARIVQRTCDVMKEHDTDDVRPHGVIDLPTIQRFINFHYSICLDLFGQEKSTNAANYYSMGIKGRYQESKIDDDHVLSGSVYPVPELQGGQISKTEISALTAINERLRHDYAKDSDRGIQRFNKIIREHGIDFEFKLPNFSFNRSVGTFLGINATPEGEIISAEEWGRQRDEWLPPQADFDFVASLMQPVTEPGKMAGWIAPPKRGIHGQPLDFEYVRFH
jgi:benzoyl-CoA 2,3-dioxygenase component B